MFTPLDSETVPLIEKPLHVPDLQEVVSVLQKELPKNFQEVLVEIVDCPNLREGPYNLAAGGLGGTPTLLEAGGYTTILKVEDKMKVYNAKTLSQRVMGEKEFIVLGTGAGPVYLDGKNCEMIINMEVGVGGSVHNKSFEALVQGDGEKFILKKIPESHTDIYSYLTNVFLSEGKPGKVLRVCCKKRIGSLNFVESIRLALLAFYNEQCVGLGGVFLMKNSTFIQHLSRNPKYLQPFLFDLMAYEMPGPLNGIGTLFSHPYGLGLRVEHFHSFSKTNYGGHYHIDNDPENVEYEGYFNLAEKVVRADIMQFNV